MKKIFVVVCLLSLVLFSTSCSKQCACTIYDETVYVDESDLASFVGKYMNVSRYGVELKKCSDVDEIYKRASEEDGVELTRVITCK